MALTATAIRNEKPGEKPKRLYDSGGLYLEIAPSGGKWWRFAYRFGGKRKLLSLFGQFRKANTTSVVRVFSCLES